MFLASRVLGIENVLRVWLHLTLPRSGLGTFSQVSDVAVTV